MLTALVRVKIICYGSTSGGCSRHRLPGAIKVHHLNCATLCPRGARLLAGKGGLLAESRLVAHCLLIEAGDDLVLVDTGFGTGDVSNPKQIGAPFRVFVRPQCKAEEPAIRQVERLGFDPADVRHIVVTHLDLDHAGGLPDFPAAEVHVFADELAAAESPSLRERSRYIPAHRAHGPSWVRHEVDGDSWFGFDSVRLLPDLDVEIAMVPLAGHTAGHCGIAVKTPDDWLLHAGDSYFHHQEVATPNSCPPGLSIFQVLTEHDGKARRQNQERLRELAREHRDDLRLICSHDPEYFDRASAA
jgi:glyoxylase-like metal-dependent hydrolase (beta-lactamase superfamily II)